MRSVALCSDVLRKMCALVKPLDHEEPSGRLEEWRSIVEGQELICFLLKNDDNRRVLVSEGG